MRTALTYLNPGSVQSHQCGRPQSLPPPRTDLANTGPPSASGSRLKRVLSLPLIPRALKFLESGPSTVRQERRKAGLIHTCLSSPHAASRRDLPGNPGEAGGFEHRRQRKAADDPFGLVSEHLWIFLPCEYRAESGPSWACGHVCLCVRVNHAHEKGEREPFREKLSGWLCVAKYKTSSKQLLQPNTRGVSVCVRGAASAPHECSGRQEARAGLGRASSGPSRERSLSEPRKNTMPGNTAWGCTCPISKPSHLRIDSSHRFLTRALSCTAGDRPSPSRPPAGPFRVPVWPVEGPLAFPGSWVSSESSRRGVCWA